MNPFTKVNERVKVIIREKAINRAKTRIVLAKRQPEDFTSDELEVIVQEEEEKIYSDIKQKGVLAVLALFGISLFG